MAAGALLLTIQLILLLQWTTAWAAAPTGGGVLRAADLVVRLDPNTAPAHELEYLPGIGPALATALVAHRARAGRSPAFRSADDLLEVPGIGRLTAERLRPWLVFPDASPNEPAGGVGQP